jgi:GntR family transcriptional regulator
MDEVTFSGAEIVRRDSHVPYYFQLPSFMEQEIKAKRMIAGQLMPSEKDMCDQLGVSRTVVRQALDELERNGYITKQSGKRSAIAYPMYNSSLMQNLRGFCMRMPSPRDNTPRRAFWSCR